MLLILPVALGLIAWFGIRPIQKRMRTVLTSEAVEDDRWHVWAQTLPLAAQFPLTGAGLGTFPYLERMSRPPDPGIDWFYNHAHNEYLELLLEGGIPALVLGLGAIGLALGFGIRGYLRDSSGEAAGLVLGGVFALTTLALHSLVDFGPHVTAVAILTVVVMAQVAGAPSGAKIAANGSGWLFSPLLRSGREERKISTVAWLLGTLGVGAVAWALGYEGWRMEQVNRFHREPDRPEGITAAQVRTRWIASLQKAAALAPDDASLQLELSDAWYEGFQQATAEVEELGGPVASAQLVLAGLVPAPSGAVPGDPAAWTGAIGKEWRRPKRTAGPRRTCKPPWAMLCGLVELNPLLDRPHIRLALHAHQLVAGEPAPVHLARARRLIPYNPEVWFLSGQWELHTGHKEAAWRHWRRSLECSEKNLAEILAEAGQYLQPGELAERVLPDKPALLWAVWEAWEDREEEVRRPLLERSLALLANKPPPLSSPDLLLRARTLQQLGQGEEALATFEELVERAPDKVPWRLELAQLLVKQGRLKQARRELRLILMWQPNHEAARALQREVFDRLEKGEGTKSQ